MQTFNQLLSRSCLLFLLAVFELTNTVQTEQPEMNLDYVEDIADNLNCFHNQQDDVDKLPCRPGYRRARDREDGSCTLCPFNEDLQTFQPEENDCDECILCSKCGEGEEVSSHCTRRRNTVCKTIVNNTVRTSTTTKDDEFQTVTTLPSTKLQPMETINGSSGLATNHPETMAKTHEDPWKKRFHWMMGYAIFITCLFFLLFLLWSVKKWMKKSVNSHPSSSGSGGDLDNGKSEAVNSHPSSSGSGGDLDNGKSEGDNEGSPDNPNGVQMNHQKINVEVHNGDESQNVTLGNTVRVRDQMENGTEEEQETFL